MGLLCLGSGLLEALAATWPLFQVPEGVASGVRLPYGVFGFRVQAYETMGFAASGLRAHATTAARAQPVVAATRPYTFPEA